MTQSEHRIHQQMSIILDAVDNSFDGVSLVEAWKVLGSAMDFAAYVYVVNRLMALGLITVDPQHVAHRVRP